MAFPRLFKNGKATIAAAACLAVCGPGCSLVNGLSKSAAQAEATQQGSAGAGGSTQSTSVPTADAVVGRIQKALPSVSPAKGNFSAALAQLATNLPSSANPNTATGLDQIPLLVYAACTDVKPSAYSVNTGQSVATNATALVSAGMTMLNLHVGNLAASGTPLGQQASAVFTTLVNDDNSAGASTAMTFVSVCLAANSFGVSMLGF